MPPFFMSPSGFENQLGGQMRPDAVFEKNTSRIQHVLRQPVPKSTQPPLCMPQQGQKRCFSTMEYSDDALPGLRNHDPTFYGLSASLPMSTYVTPLSLPPPQAPSKSLKYATQSSPDSPRPTRRRPQGASVRVRPAYGSQLTTSRRGHVADEQCRSTRYQPQPRSHTVTPSIPCTNPYAAEPPRSWNWLNEIYSSDIPGGMQGQVYHDFTFTWPTLGNQFRAVTHVQDVQQDLGLTDYVSTQTVVRESARSSGHSCADPEQFGAFHNLQATPEAITSSCTHFSSVRGTTEPTDGLFGPQISQGSWRGQRMSPLSPYEVQGKNLGIEPNRVDILADLPDLTVLEGATLASLLCLDHDLEFDSDFGGNNEYKMNTSSDARGPAQSPEKELVIQDVKASVPADSSDEAALWELLQPVVSYLSCSHCTHSMSDDLPSQEIAVSGNGGTGHVLYESSMAGDDSCSLSMIQCESTGKSCLGVANTKTDIMDQSIASDTLTQSSGPSEAAASSVCLATYCSVCGSTAKGLQTAFSAESPLLLPPSDCRFDHLGIPAVVKASDTDISRQHTIFCTPSATAQMTAPVDLSLSLATGARDHFDFSQTTGPEHLASSPPRGARAQGALEMRYDVQEYLDRSYSAYVGGLFAMDFNALPILDGEEINRSLVTSVDARSQPGAGQQPTRMTSSKAPVAASDQESTCFAPGALRHRRVDMKRVDE